MEAAGAPTTCDGTQTQPACKKHEKQVEETGAPPSSCDGSLQQHEQQQEAEEARLSLLDLPTSLLHHVLASLAAAADLAAVAATCSALRAAVHDAASWPGITSCAALGHGWSPALPASLRWTAQHCPQLQALDLSGAAALCDADLQPLSQLSSLTSLSLNGLWRVEGSSAASGGSSGRRRSGAAASQALDALAPILGSNRGLLALDLGGTSVPVGTELAAALSQLIAWAPRVTRRAYGLQRLSLAGCPRAPSGGGVPGGALTAVLVQCPALIQLDVSGCRWLTAEDLPPQGSTHATALERMPLRRVSFAGCDLLHGVGWLVAEWAELRWLDLSGTGADDADVEALAALALHRLDLSACCRVKGRCLQALARSPGVQLGWLTELRLSDLAWVGAQDLTVLLHALSSHAEAPLCLDLSGCGGLGDGALQQLAREVRLAGLRELRLAGSSRLSAAALAQLGSALLAADAPLLQGLELLDTSHVQSLGRGGAGPHGGAPAADGGDAGSPATQALLALLQAAGGSLRRAVLDGCYLGGGLLPRLVGWCSGLQGLSLVGCSGVGDADLAALTALSTLRDLAVGGSSLAWHEHRALTGLTGLTRLRIARRPFLTDAQLAPLLEANSSSLLQLELAGCAGLSDAALLHLLPRQAEDGGLPQSGLKSGDEGSNGAPEAAPQQQQEQHRRQPPPLQHLQMVCCDRVAGTSLRHLARLRSLRLPGCPAVTEAALQAAAICCTRLTALELPSHVPSSCIPVAPAGAASHLRGLRVLAGLEASGGSSAGRRGGRRRSSTGGGGGG